MTIKEALTSTVNFSIPDNRIEKALIDAALIGTANYTSAHEQAVDSCMTGLLLTLATTADIAEDDVSIKLPSRDVLLKARTALLEKWKPVEVVPKPTIKKVALW